MSTPEEPRPEEQQEEVGAIDPRRGPIPTVAPEDETGVDTREIQADKKESDETENIGR